MGNKKFWKRGLALLLCLGLLAGLAACGTDSADSGNGDPQTGEGAESGIYTPGTYTASAPGMNGDVTVAVTVDANSITDIEVTEQEETPGISDPAIAEIPAAIVEANSTSGIDAISGATITSNAIVAAVDLALLEAQGQSAPVENTQAPFEDPDVIVVGAGFAGINASITAADLGAKVYLIEKNNAIGGSVRYAGGTLSGAGTQMQADAGIVDTPEDFSADIVRMGGGINIDSLTKRHVELSARAVDWMDALGADFGDRIPTQPATYDAFDIDREHRVQGNGAAMVEVLRPLLDAHIAAGNIAMMLETEVADILMEGEAVVGVTLTDGTEYTAASIVLATGGYGHNEAWLKEYNFTNVLTDAPAFVTGDGYDFARKAGAQLSNMDYIPAYPGGVPVSDTGFVHSVTANTTAYPGVIWVDINGQRFMNEFENLDSEKKSAWDAVDENTVFILLTEEMKGGQDPILSSDEGWTRFDQEVEKGEVIFRADTVEELAGLMGVDAAALAATVETYNGYVAAGADADFGRTDSLIAFSEGPFYAVKTYPYVMLTKGGPLMNENAQTLNTSNEPIPGLFQCGELTGGANVGGAANIGGLANTSCIVWGHIAGSAAAEYALSGSISGDVAWVVPGN